MHCKPLKNPTLLNNSTGCWPRSLYFWQAIKFWIKMKSGLDLSICYFHSYFFPKWILLKLIYQTPNIMYNIFFFNISRLSSGCYGPHVWESLIVQPCWRKYVTWGWAMRWHHPAPLLVCCLSASSFCCCCWQCELLASWSCHACQTRCPLSIRNHKPK